MSRRAATLAALLLALAAGGCGGDDFAPAARTDPSGTLEAPDLSGGYTVRIVLEPAFRRGLAAGGGGAEPTGDATLRGATATFPITSGGLRVEPRGQGAPAVSGRVDLDGSGLALDVPGRVPTELQDLQLTPQDGLVVAKLVVDGSTEDGTLSLFRFVPETTRPLRLSEGDDGAVLEGTRVRLLPEGARVLRSAIGRGAPRAGAAVGRAKVTIDRDGP